MHLSGGERHDAPEGRKSIEALGEKHQGIPLVMDKAYEDDQTRKLAKEKGYRPEVPPKSNRLKPWKYDIEIYKKRNVVERLFRRVKAFRKISTRYDKTDIMFLSFVQFAFIMIWIR